MMELNAGTQAAAGATVRWYAVHTRARHEKKVAASLQGEGITAFLPLLNQLHRWSDRRKQVEVPMFSCYVFVHSDLSPEQRQAVLKTSGVLAFVGNHEGALPIPDAEIEVVRRLINQQVPFSPYPYIKVGQRVRIRGGALEGMEGILVGRNSERKMVVSVELIQKSVLISLAGYDIEVVDPGSGDRLRHPQRASVPADPARESHHRVACPQGLLNQF
jgi:transcription antitermination factor NusG